MRSTDAHIWADFSFIRDSYDFYEKKFKMHFFMLYNFTITIH